MNEFSIDAACAGYDELYHHGIPNQRWGVRNGPPYPLDQKRHRRIVSGKQDKEIKKYDKKKHGLTHLGWKQHRKYVQASDINGIQRNFVRDGQQFTRTYRNEPVVNIASIIGRGGDDELAWRTLDRPGHKVTASDVIDVNFNRMYQGPGNAYDGANDPGLSNNCGMCTAALFLRGLGYDVQAGRAAGGVSTTACEYWFDGAKPYKVKGAQALYQQLQSFGNQGKGELSVRHKNGSGHSVFFQMEKSQDGKLRPMVYDGQIQKKYTSLADFLKAEHVDMSQFVKVTRLDGATPNWGHLAEDSVVRTNFTSGDRNRVLDTKAGKNVGARNIQFANSSFMERGNWSYNRNDYNSNNRGGVTLSDYAREALKFEEQDNAARAYLKERWGV